MVNDQKLAQAISSIRQRSERQEDVHKLIDTFVDVGILPQLLNTNNQIVYGRRGTGKTHVLRVLGSRLAENDVNLVVYIDARMLGSSTQFTDETISLQSRCLALFRDVIGELYGPLLERIIERPPSDSNKALALLDELVRVGLDKIERVEKQTLTDSQREKQLEQLGGHVTPKISDAAVTAQSSEESEQTSSTTYRVEYDDKVIFPSLFKAFSELLNAMKIHLYVLFDEWSSLPLDVQPYLAEFLKRSLLPIREITLKIGSLEYRSRFSIRRQQGQYVGFELGADISANQDLDDYYVYDRNPRAISSWYADILFRHLGTELPADYLKDAFRITSGEALASKLFTERATFDELARAAEGVIRDLINIFTSAFFHAQRRERETIDKKAVLEAARQWFEQDKSGLLDDQLHTVLRRIVDEVIGKRRARSFLLPRDLERNPVIQRLFDARVLHQMQRGYADKDNPGARYNIYTVDYGTYVDLIGTSKQPDLDLQTESSGSDWIVPFDDKRSIRRIVFTEEVILRGASKAADNKAESSTQATTRSQENSS